MFKLKVQAKYEIVSFSSIVDAIEDIIQSEKFFEEWYDDEGYAGSTDTFESFCGIEGDDDEETKKEKAKDWYDGRFDDFARKLSAQHTGGSKIMLWRCIQVPDEEEFVKLLKQGKYMKGFKGVGVFWSYDQDIAECHWGGGGNTITLEAEVPNSSIDLEATARAQMNISTGDNEAEITLKEGAPLKITHIYAWKLSSGEDPYSGKPLKAVA